MTTPEADVSVDGPLFPQPPRTFISANHGLMEPFRQSASFQQVLGYIRGCAEAIFSTPTSQQDVPNIDDCCPTVRALHNYFQRLHHIVDVVPLEDLAQQRFGNRAKRVFHEEMDKTLHEDMLRIVDTFPTPRPQPYTYTSSSSTTTTTTTTTASSEQHRPPQTRDELADELAAYMRDSFGNPIRLDYGSGHELHFFIIFMICLAALGDDGGALMEEEVFFVPPCVPPPPPVEASRRCDVRRLRQEMIFHIFLGSYLVFVRRLQSHYSVEPAGSHGVWGLDDYHHLPYLFGAAQLVGYEEECACSTTSSPTTDNTNNNNNNNNNKKKRDVILPKYVCERSRVAAFRDDFVYFAMIDWILTHKSGPFFEHSNVLYNISGVERWKKIYGGMTKMFAAEVLGKFNVSQHLLFGVHLPWGTKTLP